ncbi:MAG: AraC family transcriptional regulator, partial [Flavobacteriaceae bacterium]|nr:AraC family transcriptional regulator [Flavobacteriaceae bacterium]
FIAGGLFFKKQTAANIALALYIILFTCELLDFLYATSEVILLYPDFYLWGYSLCFLFGPVLWLHFKYIQQPEARFNYWDLLHGIPFIIFLFFVIWPLLQMESVDRIAYTRKNFNNEMMPLNYIRTTHVTLYGAWMLFVIIKNKLFKNSKLGLYLTTLTLIYFLTAVLQSYLTRFADSFFQFVWYYFLASTIVLIAGFVLYRYPELLQHIQDKYFSSILKDSDRKRIIQKIEDLKKDQTYFLNNNLQLSSFCEHIDEKPHQVSQVFSSHFDTSFTHFINAQRIEHAKMLLKDPEKDHLKILAVAFESGFNNNVTFTKAFSKVTGSTPGKFRKRRGKTD